MTRGTTPEHRFQLPFSVEFSDFTVTYAQLNPVTQIRKVVVKKTQNDCNFAGSVIRVKLSQEDTLKFEDKYPVQIQIKVKEQDGDVLASDIITTTVKEILDEEVL